VKLPYIPYIRFFIPIECLRKLNDDYFSPFFESIDLVEESILITFYESQMTSFKDAFYLFPSLGCDVGFLTLCIGARLHKKSI